MGLRTGAPIGAGISPASEPDRESWTRLFHEGSTSPISHNIDASAHGVMFMAFGLQGSDRLCLEMVVGCKDGTYFEAIKTCGCSELCLTACNNVLFLPLPLRVRVRYAGARLGLFNLFAAPVAEEYMPLLAAYDGRCSPCLSGPDFGPMQCT